MCEKPNCLCHTFSMDSTTPLNLHLSAYFKRSFAFHTVKNRLPVILTKIIDHLVRNKDLIVQQFGEGIKTQEELKWVIGEISKMKYEMQTNKCLQKFDTDVMPDTKVYDWYIEERSKTDGEPKYYSTVWLLVECYMYRRIKFIFQKTIQLNEYDPFRWQKKEAFNGSLPAITALIEYLIPVLDVNKTDIKKEFFNLLQINLWGNRCDMSISNGADNNQTKAPLDILMEYENYIISNHSEEIWIGIQFLEDGSVSEECIETEKDIVEIVCDNAGYEMCTDFCLADFIITHGLAKKIIFNLKAIPWFVSDTTFPDLRWIIRKLINSKHPSLKKIGIRWNRYLREKVWILDSDEFWTYPVDYTFMESLRPELYTRLREAKLVLFKGDLNYRKLFGEKNWETTTSVTIAKQNFDPTKWCVLRTLKSDIICGLEKGKAESVEQKESDWLISGQYGVIQFSEMDSVDTAN